MNDGLNFKVCPLPSQRNLSFFIRLFGAAWMNYSPSWPPRSLKNTLPSSMAPSTEGHRHWWRHQSEGPPSPDPTAQRSWSPPVRVPDECKAFFLIPPHWLAPSLPPYHPLMIPFSLASDSVITYHHGPGTLATVHFPVHSTCHCSLKRHFPVGFVTRHQCNKPVWCTSGLYFLLWVMTRWFFLTLSIRDQIANIHWIIRKSKRIPEKHLLLLYLTMPKPLTVWIMANCGKFLRRWEYQTSNKES